MEKNDTPSGTGIGDAVVKETTVDWVQRSFGTPKEVLNVTLNHACHEVPSQLKESPRAITSTGATRRGSALWSDEVNEFKANIDTNIRSTLGNQTCNTQETQISTFDNTTTENPSLQKLGLKIWRRLMISNLCNQLGDLE